MKHVPVVLAHRGASRAAAENTIAAFRAAAELGADGVELDARRSADGVVIVSHDAVVDGLGPLVEHAASEIRTLRPDIPTLLEALDASAGIVNVEVKNLPNDPDYDPDEAVAAAVVTLVRQRQLHPRVIVSAFTAASLDRARATDRTVRTGWLTLPGLDVGDAVSLAVQRGYDAIHPQHTALATDPAGLVAAAHDAGLGVNVWTVDDPDEMRALAAAGVDGIITNVPDVARAALGPPAPRP